MAPHGMPASLERVLDHPAHDAASSPASQPINIPSLAFRPAGFIFDRATYSPVDTVSLGEKPADVSIVTTRPCFRDRFVLSDGGGAPRHRSPGRRQRRR